MKKNPFQLNFFFNLSNAFAFLVLSPHSLFVRINSLHLCIYMIFPEKHFSILIINEIFFMNYGLENSSRSANKNRRKTNESKWMCFVRAAQNCFRSTVVFSLLFWRARMHFHRKRDRSSSLRFKMLRFFCYFLTLANSKLRVKYFLFCLSWRNWPFAKSS